jgi:hypothetical protein
MFFSYARAQFYECIRHIFIVASLGTYKKQFLLKCLSALWFEWKWDGKNILMVIFADKNIFKFFLSNLYSKFFKK